MDELGLGPAEQRAQDEEPAIIPDRADSRQSGNSRAALKPHEQGLGLVVGMVGCCKVEDAAPRRPFPESRVAGFSRLALEAGAAAADICLQDRMGAVDPVAHILDVQRLDGAFLAQPVVDRCRLDPAWERGIGEEQERQAVRASGDGDTEPVRRAVQPVQSGPKTIDLIGRRSSDATPQP
jgi:hypothetical protein